MFAVLLAVITFLYFKPSISGNAVYENRSIYVSVKNTSNIGGVEVRIDRSEGIKLIIESLEIESEMELVEREHKVYVQTSNGEKETKIIPSDTIASAKKIDTVESIKIEEYKGEPVYSIYGTKKARLFFVIPLTAEVNQKINLETGKMVKTKKPWWHFLALGV
ncbi:hypothetical protein A3K73_08210 [Candidatus Pacearchaeota archaeon RBG_13_36_9]|nr:MAG: hypothetical protein A3K73_08210 [Candidatus Pacearchaeota archaeon RBG_13_36_9]